MKKSTKILERIIAYIVAIILLQTLYFKFSGAEESKYIFTQLGIEPFGRIGIGIFELITGVLLFFPKTSLYGGILGIGIISGAIISHLFILGIEVQNDGGYLFMLAIAVFVGCALIILFRKNEIIMLLNRLRGKQ